MRIKRVFFCAVLMLFIGLAPGRNVDYDTGIVRGLKAEASETETERRHVNGNLKILVTGDMHGQISSTLHEFGKENAAMGIGKLASLIQEERENSGTDETVLLDAGDTLYSYATDFFYGYNEKLVQPIYQAMNAMEYDAITLGNHEFDYGWEYLEYQLKKSGLYEKTTVSNLLYEKDDSQVLAPSVVVEKEILMSDGRLQTVRVGIVGATRQSLSTKRQRYSGLFYGTDIYSAVKKEAERLKKEGVDVVVALIHGGIGIKDSTQTVSPGGRLATVAQIDAVVTSHTHEEFPTNQNLYKAYASVDEKNGLIYGKPVVAVGSYAQNLGVINLELTYDKKGNLVIGNGSSKLLAVEETTEESETILNINKRYERYLEKKLDTTAYKLAKGCILTNVDCVANDTALYQLINNAKIAYGTSYIQEYLPEYSSYPVIAVTKNELENQDDYIMVKGSVNSVDVAKVIAETSPERPSGYLYLYKITGANLREWLEYAVSIYAQKGTQFTTVLPTFTKNNPQVSSLVQEEHMKDWSTYFAFDGISYEIDLSKPARFRADGSMISYKNQRITNLQYQGKAVTDRQEFIIVSDAFTTNYWFMPKETDSIYKIFPWVNGKDVVMEYIREQAAFGPIDIKPDNNWRFKDAEGYEFAFGTLLGTASYGKKKDWYYKHVSGERKGLQFFWGKYVTPERKLEAVLSVGMKRTNGWNVPVKVNIVSLPEGAQIKSTVYRKGYLTNADDAEWKWATWIDNNLFYVMENGTYSVLVTDSLGNRTIAHVSVDNIDPLVVVEPYVEVVTNRMREVNGTAAPHSTVWVETEDGSRYSASAGADGRFTVAMQPQKADTKIKVWASEGNRESKTVTMKIYRTGPDIPEVFEFMAGDESLVCFVEQNQIPAIIIGKNVYIVKGMSERYKKSTVYSSGYTLIESDWERYDDGSFELAVPELKTAKKIYLYAFDTQNRASLRLEIKSE